MAPTEPQKTPEPVFLTNYQPPDFLPRHIELAFDIHPGETIVTHTTRMERKGAQDAPLVLDGEDMELVGIKLNGQDLRADAYAVSDTQLTVDNVPDSFELEIVTRLNPDNNKSCNGLYRSGGIYCTQCEPEGFRKITYSLDRPDALTRYRVRIEADQKACPVLLSNGNLVEEGELDGNRHYAIWDDPYPKPSYLFALVAGELDCRQDSTTTVSGRVVDLRIYVRPDDLSQTEHAMESLKWVMDWEEREYGLEYDLDRFNIVAVSDFNMGAMENKSLNIFNTATILAQSETATDQDFQTVTRVVGHEYFHNYAGNRVTCRDWFQLSLKEGLVVFKEHQFTGEILNSEELRRLQTARGLRATQFPEDSGPTAHPVRPDRYIDIHNFYTATIYSKGGEVVEMMHRMCGPETWRKATDLYFTRFDGQAVRVEDFVECVEEASGLDLKQFKLWYEQAGTPEVTAKGRYDAENQRYHLSLSQHIPPTPDQPEKKPMHIPFAIGLVGPNGEDYIGTQTLDLHHPEQNYSFDNIPAEPVPSLLREFSAPVRIHSELTFSDLRFLARHDADGFNRWDSLQSLYKQTVLNIAKGTEDEGEIRNFVEEIVLPILSGAADDPALTAELVALPSEMELAQHMFPVQPRTLHQAREKFLSIIAEICGPALEDIYLHFDTPGSYSPDPVSMAKRSLKNAALGLLCKRGRDIDWNRAYQQYFDAPHMTDRMAALSNLGHAEDNWRREALEDFYSRFHDYPLVVDKWFAVQAGAQRSDTLENVRALMDHPDFDMSNPNRLRALIGVFAMRNPLAFHAESGEGYRLLTDTIIRLDQLNPEIAARLATAFRHWRRYTDELQHLMGESLERIIRTENLSTETYEIVRKTLDAPVIKTAKAA